MCPDVAIGSTSMASSARAVELDGPTSKSTIFFTSAFWLVFIPVFSFWGVTYPGNSVLLLTHNPQITHTLPGDIFVSGQPASVAMARNYNTLCLLALKEMNL